MRVVELEGSGGRDARSRARRTLTGIIRAAPQEAEAVTRDELRKAWPRCYNHLTEPSPSCAVCAIVAALDEADVWAVGCKHERERAEALQAELDKLYAAHREVLADLDTVCREEVP